MKFTTLDVFTNTPFRGNPLALVALEHHHLDAAPDRRQLIAREFNLSETVFLHLRAGETLAAPDRRHPARAISIFTVDRELPFAGHPVIGAAHFLLRAHAGCWDFVTTLTPPAGPIRISSSSSSRPSESVLASIPHDVHLHSRTLRSCDCDSTSHLLLHPDARVRAAELDAPVFSVVRGMAFVLVELPTLADLARVTALPGRLNDEAGLLLDAGPWGDGFVARYYYVVMPGGKEEEEEDGGGGGGGEDGERRCIRARMVEMACEDPATGSAASSLACYLSLRDGSADAVTYRVTQGVEMGRKSDIEVFVASERGEQGARVIREVKLGGTARVVMTGDISI